MSTLWDKQAPARIQKPNADEAPAAKTPAKTKPAKKAAKKA